MKTIQRSSFLLVVITISALLLSACSLLQTGSSSSKPSMEAADYVNPFVGTGGHGHTFPGATLPFGLVQLSPDTRLDGWDGCGGYHYSDSVVYGFSHTHLQGTGVSDYGDILFMPSNYKTQRADTWRDAYKSKFSHTNEVAEAGYYKTRLDNYNITAELSATTRCGIHRYAMAPGDSCRLFIDMAHRDDLLYYDIQTIGDTAITGYRVSRGWAEQQRCFFYAVFNKPFKEMTQLDETYTEQDSSGKKTQVLSQTQVFAVDFGPIANLIVRVGISGTDLDGARKNLYAEAPSWNFDNYRKNAKATWNEQLNKLPITSGTQTERKNYYTALYHACTTPNTFSDADGRYYGMDRKIHMADGYTRYSIFSLWDTFRGLHPLLAEIEPQRTRDFIRTFIDMYKESGHLPIWELAGNETDCMIGYHAASVINDAYARGITDFDTNAALEAMVATATKYGADKAVYDSLGYVPADLYSESVSKTLEYAYDDWCISQFAMRIGNNDVAKRFNERAQNWKNVYDPKTGFMRARRNGGFIEPFNPFEVNFNYTEANAWQYQFFVPHDIKGLIQIMGGEVAFKTKLDKLFSASSQTTGREQADITGLIGQYAHGNEPSHHLAFLYTCLGDTTTTDVLTKRIMTELYKPTADGLCGNEDCGQMSAWYVLAKQKRYPVCPGVMPLKSGEKTGMSQLLIAPLPIISGPITSFAENGFVTISDAYPDAKILVELTYDNTTPVAFEYQGTFEITRSCTIRAWASKSGFMDSKPSTARYVKRNSHLKMKGITPYDPQYNAGGNDAMIDGMRGSSDFRTGAWQGWQGKDVELIVDLSTQPNVHSVGISCLQETKSWIWYPSRIEVWTSADGINFSHEGDMINTISPQENAPSTHEFLMDVTASPSFVKLIVHPAFNSIPSWHLGADGKPWIFADEIILK